MNIKNHIIQKNQSARDALAILNKVKGTDSLTLFVLDEDKLVGTITDGDIRRGLLNNFEISQEIGHFMNKDFKFLTSKNSQIDALKRLREDGFKLIPIINSNSNLLEIIDLSKTITKLPISALLMAGGQGTRLKPLTDKIPKPMLKVGGKPILEHNINRLQKFGINEFFISVNYLKNYIMDYFEDGSSRGISIKYLIEDKPLGTLGSFSLTDRIKNDDLLIMNSDILTDLNFEVFYQNFLKSNSKMMVVTIPYNINIPYAIIKSKNNFVNDFEEKPTYTYHSNGGIYLLKKDLKNKIPKNTFYNATDLMKLLIEKKQLGKFSHKGFWIDIGNPKDFYQSQDDIKALKL
tara:strand:- start:9152 stop:10195 length:1044 start_codon:yes stop_codon:yes gene_type:complete